LGAAGSLTRLAAPSAGAAGAATSVAGENIIAYDLDKLFRTERRPASEADLQYSRSEAGRILLTTAGHRGLVREDHDYLVRLVSTHTGLSLADAEKRV